MSDLSPFSQASIQQAIVAATSSTVLPPGKSTAFIVLATTQGIKGIVARRLNDRWTFDGEAEYHGGAIDGSVQLVGSW